MLNITRIFLLSLTLLAFGCSSSPKLYPNKEYEKVGKAKADKDVEKCMAKADIFLESSKGKQILKGAGKGSIFGAVIGGVTGLLTGDIVQGLASGAVIGGAAGATGEAISPDRLKQSFVNRCLSKKGYEVIGWN